VTSASRLSEDAEFPLRFGEPSDPEADMATDPSADTGEIPVAGPRATDSPPEPVSARVAIDPAAMSHTGLVRKRNEDYYLVAQLGRAMKTVATNLPPGAVPDWFGELVHGFVVADGMGGSGAGDVASRLAITSLVNLVLRTPTWVMRSGQEEAEEILQRMLLRYKDVGAAISGRADEMPGLSGMGTTMTVACSLGPELFLGHVGDSRAYLLRGGTLTQLTRDHTFAQALADQGYIRQDEVGTHHLRHVLTQALGPRGGKVEADVSRVLLKSDDRLLLCTDGLHDLVPQDAIRDRLAKSATAAEACDALVEAALAAGGKDNVTAIVAHYRFPVSC
jgi:PPM family protein phosphatase